MLCVGNSARTKPLQHLGHIIDKYEIFFHCWIVGIECFKIFQELYTPQSSTGSRKHVCRPGTKIHPTDRFFDAPALKTELFNLIFGIFWPMPAVVSGFHLIFILFLGHREPQWSTQRNPNFTVDSNACKVFWTEKWKSTEKRTWLVVKILSQ